MTTETDRKPFITCNYEPAMSGHFATLYAWTQEDDYGFWEPYETGFGRYATLDEAEAEGRRWAEETGVRFLPVDREEAAAASARRKQREDRRKALIEEGVDHREAFRISREEFPY